MKRVGWTPLSWLSLLCRCDDDAKDQWFLATAKIVREEFKINTDDFDHVICDFPMLKDCQVGGQGLFREL